MQILFTLPPEVTHNKSAHEEFAEEMCRSKSDWPDCKDYWMEFTAWGCRIPEPEELREWYKESERQDALFQQHIDNEYLINTLEGIELELMDLNRRLLGR